MEPDFSHHSSEANESVALDNYGVSANNNTLVTAGSLYQTQINLLDPALQLEDQDEELEKSLLSQGSSLMELYPSMVSKIGKAWHLAEAANSVLRRYRKLRRSSNKRISKHTLNLSWRQTESEPNRKISPRANFKISPNSSINANYLQKSHKSNIAAPFSPLRPITNLHDSQANKQSPERKIHIMKTEESHSAQRIGLSQNCSELQDMILNQTFEVSQMSPRSCSWKREPSPAPNASPMRICFPKTDAFMETSPNCERLTLSTHTPQKTRYEMETFLRKCPTILHSPVGQSVFKSRWTTAEDNDGSPLYLSRNPRPPVQTPPGMVVTSYSRGPEKPRALIESPGFSSQRSVMSPKRLFIQEASHSSQSKVHSPRLSSMAGVHAPLYSPCKVSSVSSPPIKLEDEFQRHYHKLVCLDKSSLPGTVPCNLCAGSFTANRGHSSSALAALALSPHHSRLRKRYIDLDWDKSPNSKRSRQGHCPYSPGSLRYKRGMLRIQDHSSSSHLSSTATAVSRRSLFSIHSKLPQLKYSASSGPQESRLKNDRW
ncbi:uncharacterized protein si:dkeyp-117h8.4 [Lampris incognitus]|uniref:uncharacterized protein si:dkeyp-117h8.4 n=1 Tax=Lampris incognitus TaxID=2546036 RepID=UPI0024B4A58C|nr:uncharacterized protein si:dkeyp-117h8.4 [Lampris incognitus]